jgi:hypothetical protein
MNIKTLTADKKPKSKAGQLKYYLNGSSAPD